MNTIEELPESPPEEARPHDGLAGKAVRGGVVLMAARLLVQGLGWGVTLVVARLLMPDDYGVMTCGMVFLGLADLLAEAGVGRALIQKKDLVPADVHFAFTVSLSLAAVMYAGLWVVAGPAAEYMKMPPLTAFLRVLGVLVLTMPFRTVTLALLDRELRMGWQAVISVAMTCAQSATVLAMALAGAGYWALAGGVLVARTVETVLLLRAAGWVPRLVRPTRDRVGLLVFGLNVSLGGLLWFFYSNSDFAIVGKLAGAEALGLYSLAFQLISLPVQKLTVNTNQVAYPVFCRLRDDPARLRNWYLRLTVLLGFAGMPTLVGLALVAPDAFALLGGKWEGSVVPFQLLSVVGVVMVYGSSLPPLLNALGRPDINLKYTAACTLLFPLGFLIGATTIGIEGVCVAWLALYPLAFGTLVHLTRRLTGVTLPDLVAAQLPVLGGVLFMVVVVLLVRWRLEDTAWPWLRLVAAIVAGVVSYAGFLLAFARETVLADLKRLVRELRGAKE